MQVGSNSYILYKDVQTKSFLSTTIYSFVSSTFAVSLNSTFLQKGLQIFIINGTIQTLFTPFLSPLLRRFLYSCFVHMQDTAELIEGKVDWKGRPTRKDKHGGTRTSLLILGKLNNLTFHIKNISLFRQGYLLIP